MNFRQLVQDIKDKNVKPVCLLYGKEQFLVEWAKNELIQQWTDKSAGAFDVTEIAGEDTSIFHILQCCETLPVFSERRVVVVENFSILEGEKNKNIDEKSEKMLMEYLKYPAKTTLLIFTCGEKPDKRRKLFKGISESSSVYEFQQLERPDLERWVEKRFRLRQKKIEIKELRRLIDLSGYYDTDSDYSLYHFENDISKVVLYADEETVKIDDIEKTVSGNISTNVFQLIEYISKGNKRLAFDLLDDLFTYGEDEYGILALLARQYENVLAVKQMSFSGRNFSQISSVLETKEFLVKKWAGIAQRYQENNLQEILMRIYQTDKKIKSGELESRMALELLVGMIP